MLIPTDEELNSQNGDNWSEGQEEPPIEESGFCDAPNPQNNHEENGNHHDEQHDSADDGSEDTSGAEEGRTAEGTEDAPLQNADEEAGEGPHPTETEPMSEDDSEADKSDEEGAIALGDNNEEKSASEMEEGGPKGTVCSVPTVQSQAAGEGEGQADQEEGGE